MMKKLLTLILLAGISFSASAQNIFSDLRTDWRTRKELLNENQALKTSLDSLQILLDSIKNQYKEGGELMAIMEGNDESSAEEEIQYTPEVSDSLLHLWYKNSFNTEGNVMDEYNMDSVKFSSNVSDEEMMKRLAAMNSFITLPYNDVVKNYIILYSERMPSKMGRVIGLSNYYFPIFEEVLTKYGMPVELKYMAIIESMLNPVAKSRAGARGMWQFMYNTAKSYGLEINSYVDERMDVEKAIDAAARYMRDAYQIFGDWALAISSYNCGAGNISKAIRRAGGKRDFWSIYPYLPRETRGYVPAFVGAMYAMTYYREYGIVPQNVGMPAQTDTFQIRRNLHFNQINEVVGVPLEDLQNLNPQYIHEVIPGSNHMYVLKLPYTWTNAFLDVDRDTLYNFKADSLLSQKVLQDVSGASKASSKSGSSSSGRTTYKVKKGDYLGKIATRYGTTVTKLKQWNHLKSTNLQVGQILYIYGSKPGTSSSSTSSSSSEEKVSGTKIYTVKSGDTLYKISKLYPGISADEIKSANGLKSDNIAAGQKLVIPIK